MGGSADASGWGATGVTSGGVGASLAARSMAARKSSGSGGGSGPSAVMMPTPNASTTAVADCAAANSAVKSTGMGASGGAGALFAAVVMPTRNSSTSTGLSTGGDNAALIVSPMLDQSTCAAGAIPGVSGMVMSSASSGSGLGTPR